MTSFLGRLFRADEDESLNLSFKHEAFGTRSGRRRGSELDEYVRVLPSDQNALDMFKNEWASAFPSHDPPLKAGTIPLFEDPRVLWGCDKLGGIAEKKVLELGPLEGAHSYMLERGGAESVLAIEANRRAYLKCLITKETFGLKHVHLMLGDFVEYLKTTKDMFDMCFASGVLYHMRNPVELLTLIAGTAKQVYIWTHYYDDKRVKSKPDLAKTFDTKVESEHQGFRHTLYRHNYLEAVHVSGFCGGSAEYSMWMSRDEILDCLRFFGFTEIHVGHEEPEHAAGPAFCVAASKEG